MMEKIQYLELIWVGRHTVGTGSSPQTVMTSLVTEPLDKGDLKITDMIDIQQKCKTQM